MKAAGLFWFLVAMAAGTALLVVGLPLLAVAILLLKRPGTRPRLRHALAGLFLTLDAALLLVTLAAFFAPRLCESIMMAYYEYSRTYHLTAPRTLAGIRFPAGSTVFMDGDDIDHGTVPVSTVIAGLPLVGDFVANHESVAFGTLAAPAQVEGVPCAPGMVSSSTSGSMSCILAADFSFVGHPLAPGRPIRISVLEGFGRWLDKGTLARPDTLLDVLWPAGSILSGIQDEAAQPNGSPGLPDLRVEICLLSSAAAAIPGATLHGTITYTAQGQKRWVTPGCSELATEERTAHPDGHAEVGTARYLYGERPAGNAPWHWN